MKDEKISIFQTVAIYILVSIVPVVRYFPIIMTGSARKGAWVAALLSIIPNILLVFTLNTLMNKLKTKDKFLKGVAKAMPFLLIAYART